MELNEEKLENVLGGANPAVINDKVIENKDVYRESRIAEIEKEKNELLRQREEILKRYKTK